MHQTKVIIVIASVVKIWQTIVSCPDRTLKGEGLCLGYEQNFAVPTHVHASANV